MISISYCFKNNLTVNDEFYVSTAYNYLIKNKMKVYVHEIEHFMQWGTPEDLNEYISLKGGKSIPVKAIEEIEF